MSSVGDGGSVVLVSDHVDGRSRSAVAAVRALAVAGFRPVVTVSGGPSAAGASRGCAGVLRVPAVSSAEYLQVVSRYLDESGPGSSILPASDAVLVALKHPGAQLVDKVGLAVRASAAGLSVPPTRTYAGVDDLVGQVADLDFPLVVKAAVKTGADDVTRRVDSAAELLTAVTGLSGAVVVQPVVAGTMRAVCGVIDEGRLLAAVHQEYLRIWPPACGTASAAVTTAHDPALEDRLPQLLEGHSGVFQVQLIGDQVIDVNPRIYGSLPLAVAAGANLPAIACRAATGQQGPGLVRGRAGVRYRWLEGDVRRLRHDVRTGALPFPAAVRALVPTRGMAHSIESLRDPGPALVRLLDVARRRMP